MKSFCTKFLCASVCSLLFAMNVNADDIHVTKFKCAGPFPVYKPLEIDSVGLSQKTFKEKDLLETAVRLDLAVDGKLFEDTIAPSVDKGYALYILRFGAQNLCFAKAKVMVSGMADYQLFVDGKKSDGKSVELIPGTHTFDIKYLSKSDKQEKVNVKLSGVSANTFLLTEGNKHLFSMKEVMEGNRLSGVSLSPNGRFLITRYSEILSTGNSSSKYQLKDLKTGKILLETSTAIRWMPSSNRYYYTEKSEKGRRLMAVNVETMQSTILAEDLPDESYTISPTEDFLIFNHRNTGPKKDEKVYEIVEPDDRQPGWRDRNSLVKYDLQTGVSQPLTFGHHSVSLLDISRNGRFVLLMTSKKRLTKRPTTLRTIILLDLQTMKGDSIVVDDGFVVDGKYSPDGKMIAVVGSPETLDGIGKNVPEGRIPSAYDYQLYTIDLTTRKVKALTRDFNPSVGSVQWAKYDNQIYFTADDEDCVHLFKANPVSGKIQQLPTPEDMVTSCSMADDAPVCAWVGESASNASRAYTLNTRSGKSSLLEDFSAQFLKDVELGTCEAWDFVSSRGDTINGRYYLPPHFDASKKYPMIVYYYGGCTPTARHFATRYPLNAYAAMGYVVYVINPSGATGFGQEFSSRHVNTAGEGVAEDIIEGTKLFAKQHSFVNEKKIGCIGASYGGFMTQYLQTKTDIFAAAISHAGISDHTSYWGEGYWGYSYSEVSMADSYPWTDKKLYVDQSPLFNADKIHTPILFLHGVADTNVPVGESIQMFNALKLLGRETAFVAVEGENHWILNYEKRMKWQNTIYAWFAKWLKDEPEWWQSMYNEQSM
ncbi:MAG: S9 family peptidase [Prevotella sp.]|nr:S9 family peptidase [Prevotella sp.]